MPQCNMSALIYYATILYRIINITILITYFLVIFNAVLHEGAVLISGDRHHDILIACLHDAPG